MYFWRSLSLQYKSRRNGDISERWSAIAGILLRAFVTAVVYSEYDVLLAILFQGHLIDIIYFIDYDHNGKNSNCFF